ncbi:MAG TPA: DUF3368 domain-containing protein, partial [Thermoanaerobaculia bacterium]|nr:DUF3368 domain-containing protein [Thermoanaerobaculia bacterium]
MNEGPVICNAGPLIALAGIAQLPLLRALYPRVLVPQPVMEEIMRSGARRAGSTEIGSAKWLEVVPSPTEPDALLTAELGTGESAVLRVAARLRAPLVLIDERRARRIAAQVYGLRVRGTAGALVEAKRAGLVLTVRPLLEAMVHHGYFL